MAEVLCVTMAVTAWLLPPQIIEQCQYPQTVQQQQPSSLLFPGVTIAALQPDWLGAPAANKFNPGGAGNAEGEKRANEPFSSLFQGLHSQLVVCTQLNINYRTATMHSQLVVCTLLQEIGGRPHQLWTPIVRASR